MLPLHNALLLFSAKKTENDLNNPPPEKLQPVPDPPEDPAPVPEPTETDPPPVPDDFAAHQRELSRSLLSSVKKDIEGEESEEVTMIESK